jgi:hypothetical protein
LTTATGGVFPETPLGSPPARRPGPDDLGDAAYEALRANAATIAALATAPHQGWYALGADSREAVRAIADAVAALLRKPGDDTLARYAEQQRAQLAAARQENERLAEVIAAAQPRRPPADLAAAFWAAYAGRIRESGPADLAEAIAPTWDAIPDDEIGKLARLAFADIAQAAAEPTRGDYDDAAELLDLRAKAATLEQLQGQVLALRQLCQQPEQSVGKAQGWVVNGKELAARVLTILGNGE